MVPGFVIGVVVFLFILLLSQVLRLTEFVLVHGVEVQVVLQIFLYLTISFLPAVLPMSLLFSVLLAYGRMSADSEIVAFKAAGLHMGYLATPAIILGVLVAVFSAHTSFNSGPWGNRRFEVLMNKLGNSKAAATIREGTFSEGFFDMVVYAKKVDSKNGLLKKIFIYDERSPGNPITIIARTGSLISNKSGAKGTLLRLREGNIHRTSEESYTKIDFSSYDIFLSQPQKTSRREKSLPSHTLADLNKRLLETKPNSKRHLTILSEYHKRWATSFACLVFAILGAGLGGITHRRNVKSGSLVTSIIIIVSYWALYVLGDNVGRDGVIPPWISIWFANFLFLGLGGYFIRKNWG